VGILGVQKRFDADVSEFDVDILTFLLACRLFWLLFEKLGIFSNHLVTLHGEIFPHFY
jgi:hypothetical protein